MPTESEICVDELLAKLAQVDRLISALNAQSLELDILQEAKSNLLNTQHFIENNRCMIPSYCLKKASETLRKLDEEISRTSKPSLRFQFNKKDKVQRNSSSGAAIKDFAQQNKSTQPNEPEGVKLGFHNRIGENLSLDASEVNARDIALTKLSKCVVTIRGCINTVYVRDLTECNVEIQLACRAITVANCRDCNFRLICQQLRIDTTFRCNFELYTSVASMLESSKNLTFKRLVLDDSDSSLRDLLESANFSILENNWKKIDDFDWLSPNQPSDNYSVIKE